MELFLHNSDQHIYGESDPDLSQYRIFRCSIEILDSQVLFEPTEKELDLPAAAIQFCHGDGRNREVVGQEDKSIVRFRIDKFDQAQFVRIIPACIKVDECDGLVATKASAAVHGPGVKPPRVGVALGSGDEECALSGEVVQPCKVEITTVEDVERSWLDGKQIQGIDIVDLCWRDMHPTGNIPPQVEQCMRLDCAGIFAESRPWKERQAEGDRGGVEGVDRVRQIDSKAVCMVQLPGLANQDLSEVPPDAPVAMFVGMCQRAAGNRGAHSHMIELCLVSTKTALDIPQPFPIGKLREGHAEVLIHTREGFDVSLAVVSFHATGEFPVWDELHHLSKNRTPPVHKEPPSYREYSPYRNSNRSKSKMENYQDRLWRCQS